MRSNPALIVDDEVANIKAQIKRELDTIRDLMDTVNYRTIKPGWDTPFTLHRLRRALRIHYLAMKIRESTPVPSGTRELSWELQPVNDFM
jgi:L-fucose isomerase-like protein